MSRAGGYALVELLVGSACGGLAAAAALTLLAEGAGLAAAAEERLFAADAARSCADAVSEVIAGGLEGLEGATAVVGEHGPVPRVEILADSVRAIVAAGGPFEVEALLDGAWRADAAPPVRVGDTIVLLPPATPGGPAPGAVVSAVTETDFRWTSATASQRLQQEFVPRSVAVVRSIELQWRPSDEGYTLHRRTGAGRWQPLGATVAGVRVAWEPREGSSSMVRVQCDAGPAAPAAERILRAP